MVPTDLPAGAVIHVDRTLAGACDPAVEQVPVGAAVRARALLHPDAIADTPLYEHVRDAAVDLRGRQAAATRANACHSDPI